MYLIKEKIKRIMMLMGIILICSATLVIIFFGASQFKTSSQLYGIKQISNLSHLLIRQQANLFSILLTNNAKPEQLSEALETFAKEEFVIDASIYASNGELLTQSENSLNVQEHLGLPKNFNTFNNQQIVEPIYSTNGIEGFLRVTFDTQYSQKAQKIFEQIFNRLYAEFIIIFLIGIVIASSVIYVIKPNNHYLSKETKNNKITKSKNTHFHRRRRRFLK